MRTYLVLAIAGAFSGAGDPASAQTPSPNPMPDGSYDMYAGAGLRSAPNYEGAGERRTRPTPALQVEWGNGLFVSGMNAGWHLFNRPGLEFGPLLALHPARSEQGSGVLDTPAYSASAGQGLVAAAPPADGGKGAASDPAAATGPWFQVRRIGPRAEGGLFFNHYLTRHLRLNNTLLYGAGERRNGLRWTIDLQRTAFEVAPHHTLTLGAGVTVVNAAYNISYFGLRDEDVPKASGAYAPSAGVKDVHASLRWNWALSPSWLLASGVQASRLSGAAKASPLAERAGDVTLSTALAHRF